MNKEVYETIKEEIEGRSVGLMWPNVAKKHSLRIEDIYAVFKSKDFEDYKVKNSAVGPSQDEPKLISKMNKAELQALAAEKGIEVISSATNEDLRQAIKMAER